MCAGHASPGERRYRHFGRRRYAPDSNIRETCTWNASGAAAKEVKYVTISFQNAASYESGKRLMHQTQAAMNQKEGSAGMANDSASGIGDDAYYTTMGTGYTGLMVKKGDVGLKIAIYGSIPSAKRKRRENPCRRSFIQALISAQQFN